MRIFHGTSNPILSERIHELLEMNRKQRNSRFTSSETDKSPYTDYQSLKIEKFLDGEILPRFLKTIRDEDVFFIQTTDTSDSIMETLLVCDAAKRAGCKSFTLIAPYQGYSRQDKTDHIRSSIGSKVMADILEKVGITRLMTIDLHASSIQGFYNTTVIHLTAIKLFTNYVMGLNLKNLVVCSPDHGALKRNRDFAVAFPDATMAVINKRRIKPNEIHSMELIGDVKDKDVIVVDDMADTLGTLRKASELLKEKGAKSIRAIATHGILSGDAIKNLEDSQLTELLVTDSIGSVYDKKSTKLKVISSAPLIVDAIERLHKNKSIHEINFVS
jgi:ribose-phosphate pyrophosphokinase